MTVDALGHHELDARDLATDGTTVLGLFAVGELPAPPAATRTAV
jgi:hypothetical protein